MYSFNLFFMFLTTKSVIYRVRSANSAVHLHYAPNMDNVMKCVDSTEPEPKEHLSLYTKFLERAWWVISFKCPLRSVISPRKGRHYQKKIAWHWESELWHSDACYFYDSQPRRALARVINTPKAVSASCAGVGLGAACLLAAPYGRTEKWAGQTAEEKTTPDSCWQSPLISKHFGIRQRG